ncbi:putative kinase-like protein [Drosera capensis]
MNDNLFLVIIILIPSSLLITLLFLFIFLLRTRNQSQHKTSSETGRFNGDDAEQKKQLRGYVQEELICFEGAKGLQIHDILDAPGEVIGKSSYGTLYKACLIWDFVYNVDDEEDVENGRGGGGDGVVLLRFLRPACSVESVRDVVREIGVVRHKNVVPLVAVYVGGRGEKLLVHPFYGGGNLAEFIRDRKGVAWKWDLIYEISIGIVKGLCHLHSGLSKQIIHGNLKSKNILLDQNWHPYVSDYGLLLLLNPAAGQEMLETSAGQGYKAPELIKMKDVNESTDVFSLGVILLELVTGKEPINGNPSVSQEFYLPDSIRSAVLERRFDDLYHPDLLMGQSSHQRMIIKDRILKLVQLAIACCSPSPHLRPSSKEILQKLVEIGTT